MTAILSTIDSVVTNLLVVIGVLIIVSGAIKTLIEFVRYERRRKAQGHEKERFPLTRSHLSFSVILALSLFIIKLASDAVKAHSSEAYIYITVLIGIVIIVAVSYRKIGVEY